MDRTRIDHPGFRFACPECGMGDVELDYLVAVDELHCIVCLVDAGRYVRLRRWLAEHGEGTGEAAPPAEG